MKTQIDIRKSKKWAILFIVLVALSVSMYAQPPVQSGYDNLDQLAVNTENNIRYQAPSVIDDNPELTMAEESTNSMNSTVPVLLVESSQDRKDELKSNPRSHSDVVQVGYFQKSNNTVWYKMRSLVTRKPAVNCNVCTKVVSTPYVVYLKPNVK